MLRTASLSGGNTNVPLNPPSGTPTEETSGPTQWLNKQRVKLNTKLLGHQPSLMKEDKPTYREQFVPPEMSILAFLLQKVIGTSVNDKFVMILFVCSPKVERTATKLRARTKTAKMRTCLMFPQQQKLSTTNTQTPTHTRGWC